MALVWGTDSRGGYLTTPELSDIVRYRAQAQQIFRSFVSTVGSDTFGMNRGDVLQWTSVTDLEDGRAVREDEIVPTGSISLNKQSIQALEYTLGIDYNWRLDILAKLDVYHMIVQSLINSMARTLDRACAAVFRSTDLVYTPVGSMTNPGYVMGTAGVPLATAQRAFTIWDHMNIVELLGGTYHTPYFTDSTYAVVGSHTFTRSIEEDQRWLNAVQPQNYEKLAMRKIGTFGGGDFYTDSNALQNTFGQGLGEAIYIGNDAVTEIMVYPEELQAKLGQDYGRDRGMRWVTYTNWAETQKYSRGETPRLLRVAALAA